MILPNQINIKLNKILEPHEDADMLSLKMIDKPKNCIISNLIQQQGTKQRL